jgi:hemoglobin
MDPDVKEKTVDAAAEAAIMACVRRFYEKGEVDPLLGPVFEKTIHELEPHLQIVANFWSHALLGTARYQGTPFGVHANLPIEVEHFPRWLSLFTEAATETLPSPLAEAAVARAAHMTQCFQSGLFPFTDKDGRPSKVPG